MRCNFSMICNIPHMLWLSVFLKPTQDPLGLCVIASHHGQPASGNESARKFNFRAPQAAWRMWGDHQTFPRILPNLTPFQATKKGTREFLLCHSHPEFFAILRKASHSCPSTQSWNVPEVEFDGVTATPERITKGISDNQHPSQNTQLGSRPRMLPVQILCSGLGQALKRSFQPGSNFPAQRHSCHCSI